MFLPSPDLDSNAKCVLSGISLGISGVFGAGDGWPGKGERFWCLGVCAWKGRGLGSGTARFRSEKTFDERELILSLGMRVEESWGDVGASRFCGQCGTFGGEVEKLLSRLACEHICKNKIECVRCNEWIDM